MSIVLRQQHPDILSTTALCTVGQWSVYWSTSRSERARRWNKRLQAYGGVLAEPQRPVAWLADTVQADPLPQSLPGAATALHLAYDVSRWSEPAAVLLP